MPSPRLSSKIFAKPYRHESTRDPGLMLSKRFLNSNTYLFCSIMLFLFQQFSLEINTIRIERKQESVQPHNELAKSNIASCGWIDNKFLFNSYLFTRIFFLADMDDRHFQTLFELLLAIPQCSSFYSSLDYIQISSKNGQRQNIALISSRILRMQVSKELILPIVSAVSDFKIILLFQIIDVLHSICKPLCAYF